MLSRWRWGGKTGARLNKIHFQENGGQRGTTEVAQKIELAATKVRGLSIRVKAWAAKCSCSHGLGAHVLWVCRHKMDRGKLAAGQTFFCHIRSARFILDYKGCLRSNRVVHICSLLSLELPADWQSKQPVPLRTMCNCRGWAQPW